MIWLQWLLTSSVSVASSIKTLNQLQKLLFQLPIWVHIPCCWDASGTESPDNLPVQGTRLLKDTHFCCGMRTRDNMEKVPFILLIIHAGKKRLSCLNDYPKAKISRQGDLKSSKSGENKQKYLPTIYCFLPLTLKSCLTKRQIYCAAQMSRQCNLCFKTEARDKRSQCQAKGHGLVLLGALRVNRNKLKFWNTSKESSHLLTSDFAAEVFCRVTSFLI